MADITSTTVGSTTVGANYNRNVVYYPNTSATAANPFSQFGTRKLSLLKITKTGVFTAATFGTANSNTAKAIRGLQSMAEVWYVGRIDDDNLGVIVSADTLSASDAANDETQGYGLLEAALNTAMGTTGVAVAAAALA